jgi:hypothetical protein
MNRKRCARVLPRVACSALLACASSAFAEDVKDTQGPGPADPVITANCDLVDHKVEAQAFSPPATVPDTTSAGVTFGPIVLPADGMFVGHVVMKRRPRLRQQLHDRCRLPFRRHDDGLAAGDRLHHGYQHPGRLLPAHGSRCRPAKGGRWWLFVSDNAATDVFTLTRWSVHILNRPVAVAPTSWGQVKVLYR